MSAYEFAVNLRDDMRDRVDDFESDIKHGRCNRVEKHEKEIRCMELRVWIKSLSDLIKELEE